MNINLEELFNAYIDGEITSAQLDDLNKILDSDEEIKLKFEAHKTANQLLLNMSAEKTNQLFTSRVINNISSRSNYISSSYSFFKMAVLSLSTLLITSVLLIVFSAGNFETDSLFSFINFDEIDLLLKKIPSLTSIFNSTNVSLIFSVGILLLILTAVFIYDAHKKFRKGLTSGIQ